MSSRPLAVEHHWTKILIGKSIFRIVQRRTEEE